MWNKLCRLFSWILQVIFGFCAVIFGIVFVIISILLALSPYILAAVLTIFLISLML